MSDEWVGVVTAAAPKYLQGAVDLTIRKRLILAMLERRGLITTDYLGSHEERFDVDWKDAPIESYGDGATVVYSRRDYLKQAAFDWRGYIGTDLMTLKEMEMAKPGPHVLVNRYKRILPKLTKGLRKQIGLEFYVDGYAAGNENRFCGIESFCGADTSYDSTGADVADIIAKPSDTYFGLSTAVHQGGTWSANLTTKPNANIAYDWPEGEGSPEFDYWSPKLYNWGSTTWLGGSDTTFVKNGPVCLRTMIQHLSLASNVESASLYCVMAGHLLRDFKTAMDTYKQTVLPHPEARDLGFPDVLNYEGLALQAEFGVPVNTFYACNVDTTELCIISPKLINSKGPFWDPDSFSWKFAVYTFGNFKFLPKNCAKGYPYATS